MTANEIATAWLQTYNEGNAQALAQFYHPEAVHDRVADITLEGSAAIRKKYEEEFATARLQCRIENIHEADPWIILEWQDSMGFRGCVFFKIENQQIVHQKSYWDSLSYMKHYNLPSSIH